MVRPLLPSLGMDLAITDSDTVDYAGTSMRSISDLLDIEEIECEQSDAPNTYPLALGLLTHPERQRSGAGDRGRSITQ